MSRSLKKGPFVEPSLVKKIERLNKSGDKRVINGLYHRKHGGPQAWRVRANACVP